MHLIPFQESTIPCQIDCRKMVLETWVKMYRRFSIRQGVEDASNDL